MAYLTPTTHPAGGLARAPVRGYDRTSENLILPSVWTCQNHTFHIVSKKLARADGVVVSHDRTKVVWCCVTKAQKKRNDGSSPEFSEQYARARGLLAQGPVRTRARGWYPDRYP